MEMASHTEKFLWICLKIFIVEKSLVTAIPKMKDAATTEELKDDLKIILSNAKNMFLRLEKVFQLRGQKPEGKNARQWKA